MPYQGEFAEHRSLHRLVSSERVHKLLGAYRVRELDDKANALDELAAEVVEPTEQAPEWLMAIDGSHAEVVIRNGYPGAEASYLTVASVLIHLSKVLDLSVARPMDPKELRATQQATSIDCALPGCNVVFEGESGVKSSFRKSLYEIFSNVRMSEDGESLLDTYEALLAYKPSIPEQGCPIEYCDESFHRQEGQFLCHCRDKQTLYSTDGLRIHERMESMGGNGMIYAEVMQVIERIWMIHVLRTLEHKEWLSSLRRIAIIIDGPLAVFGQPAWLSKAIQKELVRLNIAASGHIGDSDILIIGVEKTGLFVDHFNHLDLTEEGTPGRIENGGLALITDGYLKKHIIFSDSPKPYGADTYFGRKFFYKSDTGSKLVFSLPMVREEQEDRSSGDISIFPSAHQAVAVLRKMGSSRFENADLALNS